MRRSELPVETYRITLTATGEHNPASKGTVVFLADPQTASGRTLPLEKFVPGPGWKRWELGGRWVANLKPGETSSLTFTCGSGETTVLPMPMFPEAGIVRLQCNDEPVKVIDLYSPKERWHVEKVLPAQRRDRYVARLPFSWSTLSLQARGGEATCLRLQVLWGERVLYDHREPFVLGERPVASDVPPLSGWLVRWWAVKNVAVCLVRAIVACGVAFLLGLPVAFVLFRRLAFIERYTLAIAAGAALPIIISISVTHFHGTEAQSFWIAVLVFGIASFTTAMVALWRGGGRLVVLVPTASQLRTILVLLAVSVCLAPLAFYPVAGWPHWYLGQSYTDTFYYFNTAAAFEHHSLNIVLDEGWRQHYPMHHLVAGTLGYRDRSGDFLALYHSATLANLDPRSAFAQFHFDWWFLLPLVSYCLFTRLGCRSVAVWLGVVIMSLSANLLSIFTQDYLAQFLFANLLLHVMLASVVYVMELEGPKLSWPEHLSFIALLAIVMAACVGIYPSQFLFPLAFAAVMGLQALRQRSPKPLVLLSLVGIATAVLANIGLLPLLSASHDAVPYLQRLNEIARGVVFTFHDRPAKFLAIMLGLDDWVQHSRRAYDILPDVLNGAAARVLPLLFVFKKLQRLMLVVALVLTVLGALACLLRSVGGRLVTITLALYVLTAAVLGWKQQPYPYGKQLITCGVLFLPCMVVGLDLLLRSAWRPVRPVAFVFALAFMAYNVRSIWLDNSLYLLSAHHPLLFDVRTHIGAVTEDVRELAEFPLRIPAGAEPTQVVVVGRHLAGAGTDRDVVVMNHLYYKFRECRLTHDPSPPQWARLTPCLAVVFEGFQLPPDIAARAIPVLENPTYRLYTIAGNSSAGSRPPTVLGTQRVPVREHLAFESFRPPPGIRRAGRIGGSAALGLRCAHGLRAQSMGGLELHVVQPEGGASTAVPWRAASIECHPL